MLCKMTFLAKEEAPSLFEEGGDVPVTGAGSAPYAKYATPLSKIGTHLLPGTF